MEEKILKQLPTFWTFITENGVKTIHQLRFKELIVDTLKQRSREYVVHAVMVIAGRNELFVDGRFVYKNLKSELYKKHRLDQVFPTKEQLELYLNSGELKHEIFSEFMGGDIKDNNPLRLSEWSWINNIPQNMVLTDEGVKGYRWNGIKTILVNVTQDIPERVALTGIDETFNLSYKDSGMYFDMVSRKWMFPFAHTYYATSEECENANKIKVYTFD